MQYCHKVNLTHCVIYLLCLHTFGFCESLALEGNKKGSVKFIYYCSSISALFPGFTISELSALFLVVIMVMDWLQNF